MIVEPAAAADNQEQALARACHALWSANLSLMVAFMQQPAPAHRLLLARRIARNFDTLKGEACFTPATRESFVQLSQRWHEKVRRLSPEGERLPARGLASVVPAVLRVFGAR